MPVRPGNPHADRNMAGVIYKSDAPQDQTANSDLERPEGGGLHRDAGEKEVGRTPGATAEPGVITESDLKDDGSLKKSAQKK
jgi:hypothetical protein